MNYRTSAARAALILVLLGLTTITASATHFRYGTVRWQPTGVTNQIQFTIEAAYRRGFPGFSPANPIVGQTLTLADQFNFGDAAVTTPSFTVTSINATEDWVIAQATFTHTYASAGTRTAFFTNCCRLSTLQLGMNDQDYRLTTTVNVGTGNRSPVSSTLPFVRLVKANPVHFFVAASDPDGDTRFFRFATAAEYDGTPSGLVSGAGTLPVGLAINSSTGELTWNTSALATNALYAVQVIVEDRDINNVIKSKVPVDFIIQIVNPVGTVPSIALNPSGNETVNAGTEIEFDITGTDNDAGATVTLSGSGIPGGAAIAPAFPNGGSSPRVSTFTWTPSTSDAGSHPMTFAATDENGQQSLTSKTIIVNRPPVSDAGDNRTDECTGATHVLDGTGSSDPDGNTLSYTWRDALNNVIGATATINVAMPFGANTFTLTVDDGNATDVSSVTVTVTDTQDPVPDAASLSDVNGTCSASIASAPTATDACGGAITATTVDATSYSSAGTYDVHWSYNDGNGNVAMQVQQVVVSNGAAPVPDVASLPDVTGDCSATISAPTATSECFGAITGTTTDPTSYSVQGSYIVHWVYDDGNGGVTNQNQNVIINDNANPTISVSLSPNSLWPPNNQMVDITATISTSDNCDGALTVTLVSITSSEAGSGFYNLADLGTDDREFQLKAQRNGNGNGRTYTVTYSVSDGNGNSATASATVFVAHSQGNGKRVVETEASGVLGMSQVFPNPFSGATTIAYTLTRSAHIVLDVVDMNGTVVRSLVDGIQSRGTSTAIWNGANDRGVEAPSGTYLMRLRLDDGTTRIEQIVLHR